MTMEIIKYILGSFWRFWGAVILIGILSGLFVSFMRAVLRVPDCNCDKEDK